MNHLDENTRICGELSGVPFVNATRPALTAEGTYACPQGTQPCLENAAPEITMCIPDNEPKDVRCPITDIQILSTTDADDIQFW